MLNREYVSKYAVGVCDDHSPYEFSVGVWRFTNSSKHGKGQTRLFEIAEQLFDKFFGECSSWDLVDAYELDSTDSINLLLNAVVGYSVEVIKKSGVDTIAKGVFKW